MGRPQIISDVEVVGPVGDVVVVVDDEGWYCARDCKPRRYYGQQVVAAALF